MGVKHLWAILDGIRRTINLKALNKYRFSVDTSIILSAFQNSLSDQHGNPEQNAPLKGLYKRICRLLSLGIHPVFVFDGPAIPLKRRIIQERRMRHRANLDRREQAEYRIALLELKKHILDNIAAKTTETKDSHSSDDWEEVTESETPANEPEPLFIDPDEWLRRQNAAVAMTEEPVSPELDVGKEPSAEPKPSPFTSKRMTNLFNLLAKRDLAASQRVFPSPEVSMTQNPGSSQNDEELFGGYHLTVPDPPSPKETSPKETPLEDVFRQAFLQYSEKLPQSTDLPSLFDDDDVVEVSSEKEEIETTNIFDDLFEEDSENDKVVPQTLPPNTFEGGDIRPFPNVGLFEPKRKSKTDMDELLQVEVIPTLHPPSRLSNEPTEDLRRSHPAQIRPHTDHVETIQTQTHKQSRFQTTPKQDLVEQIKIEKEVHITEMSEQSIKDTTLPELTPSPKPAKKDRESPDMIDQPLAAEPSSSPKLSTEDAHTSIPQPPSPNDLHLLSPLVSPPATTFDAYRAKEEKRIDQHLQEARKERQQVRIADTLDYQLMLKDCMELLSLFNLQYVQSAGEAEAMCIHLEKMGLVDGILSEDSDCFPFGGRLVVRGLLANYDGSRRGPSIGVCAYLASDIEHQMHMSQNDLIDLSEILGCDYSLGLENIGKQYACDLLAGFRTFRNQLVEDGGDDDELPSTLDFIKLWIDSEEEEHPFDAFLPKRLVTLRKSTTRKLKYPRGFPSKDCREAFLHPKCMPPLSTNSQDPNTLSFTAKPLEFGVADVRRIAQFLSEKVGWHEERIQNELGLLMKTMREIDQNKQMQGHRQLDLFLAGTPIELAQHQREEEALMATYADEGGLQWNEDSYEQAETTINPKPVKRKPLPSKKKKFPKEKVP
ncbi:putative DNA repair protein rad13 [Blattamonas nauphoetae]|uniref:DNA repair protein rad13 n=1 Tax=Blattamonas nauphoetae TaxID=2049346 RepID=A0ABQ9Y535_9EUKA|nr:putative DNA repair protein rad13 [Blattamonas nauphoetae]